MPDDASGAAVSVMSMTGTGVATGATEVGETTVELRSVNGRGLSIKVRLAPDAAGWETGLEQVVRARLRRGNVTIVVDVVAPPGAARIDEAAAVAAAAQLRALVKRLDLRDEVRLADVLALPGVVARPDPVRTTREPPAAVAALLRSALDRLLVARREEGKVMAAAVGGAVADIERLCADVAARWPAVIAEHRDRLLRRVNEFLAAQGLSLAPADVVREVALVADRTDLNEELHRLRAHAARARELLAAGGEVGRPLEFLAQELLREANTVASKAADAQIAHAAILMKSHADRLKELAANLE
jgi:uncharacterized protein (TIGR00255 family)